VAVSDEDEEGEKELSPEEWLGQLDHSKDFTNDLLRGYDTTSWR
jgi:hypothetical protein